MKLKYVREAFSRAGLCLTQTRIDYAQNTIQKSAYMNMISVHPFPAIPPLSKGRVSKNFNKKNMIHIQKSIASREAKGRNMSLKNQKDLKLKDNKNITC